MYMKTQINLQKQIPQRNKLIPLIQQGRSNRYNQLSRPIPHYQKILDKNIQLTTYLYHYQEMFTKNIYNLLEKSKS